MLFTRVLNACYHFPGFVYDQVNHKTTVTDALGNVSIYSHDSLLRVIQEQDPLGATQSYDYDSAGNRVLVTDRNGNLTSYEYDTRGNVTRNPRRTANTAGALMIGMVLVGAASVLAASATVSTTSMVEPGPATLEWDSLMI